MLSIYGDNLQTMTPDELLKLKMAATQPQNGSLLFPSGPQATDTSPAPVATPGGTFAPPSVSGIANTANAPVAVPPNPVSKAGGAGFLTRFLAGPEAEAANPAAATPQQLAALKPGAGDYLSMLMSLGGTALMGFPATMPIGLALMAGGGAGVGRGTAGRNKVAQDIQEQAVRGPETIQGFGQEQAQQSQTAAQQLENIKGNWELQVAEGRISTDWKAAYNQALHDGKTQAQARDFANASRLSMASQTATLTSEARFKALAEQMKLDPKTLALATSTQEAGGDWTKVLPPRGMYSGLMVRQVGEAMAQDLDSKGLTGAALQARSVGLKATTATITGLQKNMGNVDAFQQSLDSAISATGTIQDQLQKNYPELLTPSKWVNAVNQWVAKGASDNPLLNSYLNAINTVTTENAKIISGSTGSSIPSSDSARKTTSDLVGGTFAPQSTAAVMNLMKAEAGGRRNGFINAMNGIMQGQFPDQTHPAFNKPELTSDMIQAFKRVAGGNGKKAQQLAHDFNYNVEAPQ